MAGRVTLGTQSMGKGMTIAGMVVAAVIFILFAIDLAVGFPFQKASKGMDVSFIICAIGLGILSWTTMRDLD